MKDPHYIVFNGETYKIRELMWTLYWEGYKHAYDVEEMDDVSRRAAKRKFETFYERNYE